MTELSANYDIRRFEVAAKGEPGYEQAEAWSRAMAFGFHESTRTDEHVAKSLEMNLADQRAFTGAYQSGSPAPHSLPAEVPVATFGTFRKSLNIGFGRELEALLVTAVTVRTPHRRRGLLRRMMTEELTLARQEGLAVAALTASEGSIYRRFGFGVASFERSISVETTARFRLARSSPGMAATGTAEVIDPAALLDIAPQVFARVHRQTPGSVDRHEFYRRLVSGSMGRDGKEDTAIKAALHYGPGGGVDGYVSYKFLGWDTKPYTVEVVDLVAATNDAYLELWQYLAAIDLVERVTWAEAPLDDPLAWALEDPRTIESADSRDMLWLRILDVEKALTARRYPMDGRLVLEVGDPLGFTGGTFAVEVSGGEAKVGRAEPAEVELSLDISALSSIYLGAVSPVTLAAAGRIREERQGAALTAQGMFAVERATHCLTHF